MYHIKPKKQQNFAKRLNYGKGDCNNTPSLLLYLTNFRLRYQGTNVNEGKVEIIRTSVEVSPDLFRSCRHTSLVMRLNVVALFNLHANISSGHNRYDSFVH